MKFLLKLIIGTYIDDFIVDSSGGLVCFHNISFLTKYFFSITQVILTFHQMENFMSLVEIASKLMMLIVANI